MKVVLVDDEQLALDLLDSYLSKMEKVKIVGKYTDSMVAKEKILNIDVDVIFLDVHQPGINGIELAEQILEFKPEIVVIFVTGYDEYAVRAFELDALDYLVKPISRHRLEKTIKRIENHLALEQEKPVFKEDKVQINVFRQLTIKNSNEKDFQPIKWRTTKAQELFLYLFHHRNQLVRKSILVELLWPDFDFEGSYSQLYTTVYHVRKAIKKWINSLTIKNTSEGYILKTNNVMIDVEEWEQQLRELPAIETESIEQYVKLINQYTGAYLQEYNYWWAEAERHRLEMMWLNLAFKVADWYCQKGEVYEAITLYEKICVHHPETEEAYFSLMKIYSSLGKDFLVHKKYNQLEKVLTVELQTEPSDHIVTWYHKWNKDN